MLQITLLFDTKLQLACGSFSETLQNHANSFIH